MTSNYFDPVMGLRGSVLADPDSDVIGILNSIMQNYPQNTTDVIAAGGFIGLPNDLSDDIRENIEKAQQTYYDNQDKYELLDAATVCSGDTPICRPQSTDTVPEQLIPVEGLEYDYHKLWPCVKAAIFKPIPATTPEGKKMRDTYLKVALAADIAPFAAAAAAQNMVSTIYNQDISDIDIQIPSMIQHIPYAFFHFAMDAIGRTKKLEYETVMFVDHIQRSVKRINVAQPQDTAHRIGSIHRMYNSSVELKYCLYYVPQTVQQKWVDARVKHIKEIVNDITIGKLIGVVKKSVSLNDNQINNLVAAKDFVQLCEDIQREIYNIDTDTIDKVLQQQRHKGLVQKISMLYTNYVYS